MISPPPPNPKLRERPYSVSVDFFAPAGVTRGIDARCVGPTCHSFLSLTAIFKWKLFPAPDVCIHSMLLDNLKPEYEKNHTSGAVQKSPKPNTESHVASYLWRRGSRCEQAGTSLAFSLLTCLKRNVKSIMGLDAHLRPKSSGFFRAG